MPLQALKIVKEQFKRRMDRARADMHHYDACLQPGNLGARCDATRDRNRELLQKANRTFLALASLRDEILARIENECIEQPEPGEGGQNFADIGGEAC